MLQFLKSCVSDLFPFLFSYWLQRTGGNSWSSGTAPPSPPGENSSVHRKVNDDGIKSLVTGLTIAGIALGVLVLLVIIISLFSRKSSRHSSHFFDEERFSQQKSFSLASQELPKDLRSDICKDYKGNYWLIWYNFCFLGGEIRGLKETNFYKSLIGSYDI